MLKSFDLFAASYRFPPRSLTAAVLLFAFAACSASSYAIGQPQYIEFTPVSGGFTLAAKGAAAKLYVDSGDWWGVVHAAQNLQTDIRRVTGITPPPVETANAPAGDAVLIGTIGKSRVIDRLIREHKIDVSSIRGKWEATLTQVVNRPLPGVARALVIAGSDELGTIYGIYDLSGEIGVSPLYWWADVPVKHHTALYAEPGLWVVGPPAVKYRGIFLNDEAPSLTDWVDKRYGGYNHLFYTRIFDLLLRVRANYLWPAMWNSAFDVDDPQNPVLANEYGIFMGTSHEEPMMCAEKEWKPSYGPWDYATNGTRIDQFWCHCMERDKDLREVVTLGMRGHNDTPMPDSGNIALMEKIFLNQRQILRQTVNPDIDKIPQLFALYKEVERYYDEGLQIPDDVTLLWSDDNWGNLRHLPTSAERERSGGNGIYYHLDYVGGPRSYKWVNTYPISKIWQQMDLAWKYKATRIWIVNVGDLQPKLFPAQFFLNMAWDPGKWGPQNLQSYTREWAADNFGPAYAGQIAHLISTYAKYNGRRKPEQLDPDTFSLINFSEAQRVSEQWKSLTAEAELINRKLPPAYRAAYYELVLYPLKASAVVNELYIAAGENALYAKQGRVSTNDLADRARKLFAEDAALSWKYNHGIENGKWDHMMDQTHIGYYYWNQPPVNAMPAVTWVQPLHAPHMAVAVQGSAFAVDGPFPALTLPAFDVFNRQTRQIDVFNSGDLPFSFTAAASRPWIHLNTASGTVTKSEHLLVSIDWGKVPQGGDEGSVTIRQKNGPAVTVGVSAFDPAFPTPDGLRGFVEARHYVSIDAAHFTSRSAAGRVRWVNIPNYGETLSGMTIFPVTAESILPPQPAPTLSYHMYLFDQGQCSVTAILAPTLDALPNRGERYAISFDDRPAKIVNAAANDSQAEWAKDVSDGVRKVTTVLNVPSAGYHTLKFSMIDPGVVLEKLLVAFADPHAPQFPGMPVAKIPRAPSSYLGPPESYFLVPSSNK
ncbi:MAG: glycosyl hydrolase 115 family protein [Terracidiphilus sp.]